MLLSDAAYKQVLWIKGEYSDHSPNDRPETLFFGVGQYTSGSGGVAPPNVAVGFFLKSNMNAAIRAAQRQVRGLDYVIVGSPEPKKVIGESLVDYSETEGFFLRPMGGGEPVAVDSLFPADFAPLKLTLPN